jgi:type IX secretion system PorP/SprF family membrane protein
MKVKFTILVLIFGFLANHLKAQQDPQLTQFMNNKLFYNPGFAGSTPDRICVNLAYRSQWVGYGGGTAFTPEINGAKPVGRGDEPTTLNFGIHGNIKRFGIGLNIWRDNLGFTNTLSPTLSLSYIQPFNNGSSLAFGLGVGIIQKGINGSKLVPLTPGDPLIPTGDIVANAVNLDFGIYYKIPQLSIFDDFYFGLSSLHLNSPVVEFPTGGDSKQDRHYYAYTGGIYRIKNIDINPNVFFKSDGVKTSFDFNCLATYNQTLVGGLSYRTPQEFSLLAGYNLPVANNVIQFMYSYDLITSDIVTYNQGSHEISIRYCFGISVPPRQVKPFYPLKTPRML